MNIFKKLFGREKHGQTFDGSHYDADDKEPRSEPGTFDGSNYDAEKDSSKTTSDLPADKD